MDLNEFPSIYQKVLQTSSNLLRINLKGKLFKKRFNHSWPLEGAIHSFLYRTLEVKFLLFWGGGGHRKSISFMQFLKILMVSDKTIHKAFRTHTTFFFNEMFNFHYLPKLYIGFNSGRFSHLTNYLKFGSRSKNQSFFNPVHTDGWKTLLVARTKSFEHSNSWSCANRLVPVVNNRVGAENLWDFIISLPFITHSTEQIITIILKNSSDLLSFLDRDANLKIFASTHRKISRVWIANFAKIDFWISLFPL